MIGFFRKIRNQLLKENKLSNYLVYAIGEILLVVVGILIALYINNWSENQKQELLRSDVMALLKEEVKENQNVILAVKDYHIMVRDTISKIEKPKSIEDKSVIGFWQGFSTPRLQDAAFQTCVQSGVSSQFSPELLQSLNRLYTTQEVYNESSKAALQGLYDKNFSDFENFEEIMTFVQMAMFDISMLEKELMVLYEQSLKNIQGKK